MGKKIIAWMHDVKGRVDIIHDDIKQIWEKVNPEKVKHYTIALAQLDDDQKQKELVCECKIKNDKFIKLPSLNKQKKLFGEKL